MSRKSLLHCTVISAVLALLLPLLIQGLWMAAGSSPLTSAMDPLLAYLLTAVAGFIVLEVATLLARPRRQQAQASSAPASTHAPAATPDVEDDDREQGVVKWFNVNKGYGFITRDVGGEEDVFVHFRALRGKGHRTLAEGQRVRYYAMRNDRGLQAEDVTVIT
ncbi:cold-shock protein [Larsenimonas rhizosphaerae]|uniref:cold-shock protein n=1 Tax=Larsenimonas rhizosphaerae TaxID=2944682 RepID=UPI002AFFFF5A|nr:cold shock domain-containing protein [Larsenimonas rhizosphaerae]